MQCCLGTALGEVAWHTRDDKLMDEAEKVLGTAAAEGEQIWSAAARQSSKDQQEREEREKESRERQRKASSVASRRREESLRAAAAAAAAATATTGPGDESDDEAEQSREEEEEEEETEEKKDEEPIVADFRLITCLERLSMFAGFYRKDKAQAERLAMKVANIVSEMREAGKGRVTQLVSKENLEEALAFLGAVHEGKFLSPMA